MDVKEQECFHVSLFEKPFRYPPPPPPPPAPAPRTLNFFTVFISSIKCIDTKVFQDSFSPVNSKLQFKHRKNNPLTTWQ